MRVSSSLPENHMIRKIFVFLCGIFLLMLGLFLYQTFKPRYSYYESNNYDRERVYWRTDRPHVLTVPELDEIAANETNAEEQWEKDEVYFGDDLLSSTDDRLQRYRIHMSARTWFEAVTICWNEDGHLATPRDVDESRLLGRMLRAAIDTGNITNSQMKFGMHVGLNSIVSKSWTSLEGEKVERINWLRRQFDCQFRDVMHSCSAVLPNGRITEHHCAEKLIYACDMMQENRSRDNRVSTSSPVISDAYEAVGEESRYKIHRSPLPWWDALEVCENEGGYLMAPRKQEQGKNLGQWFTTHLPRYLSSEGVFLGINNFRETGSWIDTQGQPFPWYKWETRHLGQETNCAVLLPSGKIDFISCDKPKPFICEQTIPENTRGEIEYVQVEGFGRYAFHNIPQNWGQAVLRCLFENATLAVPDSPREAQLLTDMYSKCTVCTDFWVTPNFLWVGINDLDDDKIWRKLTGERIFGSGFNEWNSDMNPHVKTMNCGGLQKGIFVYNYCETTNVFICEKPL